MLIVRRNDHSGGRDDHLGSFVQILHGECIFPYQIDIPIPMIDIPILRQR